MLQLRDHVDGGQIGAGEEDRVRPVGRRDRELTHGVRTDPWDVAGEAQVCQRRELDIRLVEEGLEACGQRLVVRSADAEPTDAEIAQRFE